MAEISPTLCKQGRLLKAIYNVQEDPSTETWQALETAAGAVYQSAVEELTQIKTELAELMSSSMNLSLPADDIDEEELVTNRLCELNAEIEFRAQSFIEINAIRLDAKFELDRACKALASQHS